MHKACFSIITRSLRTVREIMKKFCTLQCKEVDSHLIAPVNISLKLRKIFMQQLI